MMPPICEFCGKPVTDPDYVDEDGAPMHPKCVEALQRLRDEEDEWRDIAGY